MSKGQPSKKPRLEKRGTTLTGGSVQNRSDDNELWGEDLCVDDQLMQEIESQAISQYQTTSKFALTQNDDRPQRSVDCDDLEQRLQMKQGEVTNLRMEIDKMSKEFKNQLDAKDGIIEKLNKQLRGKESELEFQIAEMKSQTCKTPKISKHMKPQQNASNSSFYERFPFTQGKSLIKDGKIFNFGGQLNKGDILYKLVHRAFDLNEANSSLRIEKGNGFTLFLNCCLLQLCRFTSFDKPSANGIITLIMSKSREVLSDFLVELCTSDDKIDRKCDEKNAKIIVLLKDEKNYHKKSETCLLLTNAKWFSEETAVAVRQTITMLAKLIQIEETHLTEMVTEVNKPGRNRNSEQNKYAFDAIELLDEIVKEIALQREPNQFPGVYSSILYFCYTFCTRYGFDSLDDRHKTLMVNILNEILFSLPGFIAVQYIIDFLNSSARLNLSDHLCRRSAADTFCDNFTSFSFTRETCTLQVLCAHLEIIEKSAYFIHAFVAWLVKITTASSRRIKLMKNQTDPKLCECLPTLEQTAIKIMLRCVEWSDSASLKWPEKVLLRSSVKKGLRIFKQFKWQDDLFQIHIAHCAIEYEMLLFNLMRITDNVSAKEFTSEELKILRKDNQFQPYSTSSSQNRLIETVLNFSPVIEHES